MSRAEARGHKPHYTWGPQQATGSGTRSWGAREERVGREWQNLVSVERGPAALVSDPLASRTWRIILGRGRSD